MGCGWEGACHRGGVQFDLDDWLAEPQVRTYHRRSARADAGGLWRAAQTLRVGDSPVFGRAVRWRIPGTTAALSYRDLLRRYPFVVIAEGSDWSVSGLCGRIWTLQRDYPELASAEEFHDWSEPGTVRVLIAHWVEPESDGRSALVSEARIAPTDRRAALQTRALWMLVGHFDRLIAGEVLGGAVRRAERASS